VLDPLRGLAALLVVLFHYSGSVLPSVMPNPFEGPFAIGKSGVQVFFVISGFVIPFALTRRGYGWGDLPVFMARRYVRIAPPAYVAMLACILYQVASILINGRPVTGSHWPGLGPLAWSGNLVFMPEYFGTEHYNFVFWTLGIEFQFYLFIGCMLPLLLDPKKEWRTALVLILALGIGFIPGYSYFRYGSYFTLGIALYLQREGLIGRGLYGALTVLACAAAYFQHEPVFVIPAMLTAGAILFQVPIGTRPLNWLGRVSFSLYITHVPTAYFAEAVLKRMTDLHLYEWGRVVLFVVYVMLSLVVAGVFHKLLEVPALRWSQRIGRKADQRRTA
jgi:peptidoglycan/LPS O-acetylase OafA/YrhL